jgi:hypothetical protein
MPSSLPFHIFFTHTHRERETEIERESPRMKEILPREREEEEEKKKKRREEEERFRPWASEGKIFSFLL